MDQRQVRIRPIEYTGMVRCGNNDDNSLILTYDADRMRNFSTTSNDICGYNLYIKDNDFPTHSLDGKLYRLVWDGYITVLPNKWVVTQQLVTKCLKEFTENLLQLIEYPNHIPNGFSKKVNEIVVRNDASTAKEIKNKYVTWKTSNSGKRWLFALDVLSSDSDFVTIDYAVYVEIENCEDYLYTYGDARLQRVWSDRIFWPKRGKDFTVDDILCRLQAEFNYLNFSDNSVLLSHALRK